MIIFIGNNRYQIISVSVIIDSFAFKYKYFASFNERMNLYKSLFDTIYVEELLLMSTGTQICLNISCLIRMDVENNNMNCIVNINVNNILIDITNNNNYNYNKHYCNYNK